jgi:hypothetical protein
MSCPIASSDAFALRKGVPGREMKPAIPHMVFLLSK